MLWGCSEVKKGNNPDKLINWKKILEDKRKVPSCPRYTDADKVQLQSFKDADIDMGDTAFGRFFDKKKKEESAVYRKMSVEERESLKLAQRFIDEQEQMKYQFARWGWIVHVNN